VDLPCRAWAAADVIYPSRIAKRGADHGPLTALVERLDEIEVVAYGLQRAGHLSAQARPTKVRQHERQDRDRLDHRLSDIAPGPKLQVVNYRFGQNHRSVL